MIKVITPRLRPGVTVRVAGNHPTLGNWDPLKAPAMIPGAALPLWTLTLPDNLPSDTEYKFVTTEGDQVSWEEGENRRLNNRGPLEFRGMKRWKGTGVAIPVFSLRSENDFGVGDFEDLKLMADYAARTGMSVIQILPINDTTMSRTAFDSYPYNANSSFALHPLYLRPTLLGTPTNKDVAARFEATRRRLNELPEVDYEAVMALKEEYARYMYAEKGTEELKSDEFLRFLGENCTWLLPYAAYSVLRDRYATANHRQWGNEATYSNTIVVRLLAKEASRRQMGYYMYLQYHLQRQLHSAVAHCHARHIALKGDIPIGISPDSCDAWQNPELFNLGMQAGAPPDDFAREGQNWGFPTYNWGRMARDSYAWWRARFTNMAQYFDAYRIDHVLGFFRIWEIPSDSVYGLLGHFSPALPLSPEEMKSLYGFTFRPEMARPLQPTEGYANQREALAADRRDLLPLFADRLFVEDPYRPGRFHPRIAGYETEWFTRLPQWEQNAYRRLHEDFFYHRHNDLWRDNALKRLPALTDATPMLACAEDLGMIPQCVPSVLSSLQILSLEVQRMPKAPGVALADPSTYPYLSVATTSTHDMPPLRLWWLQTHTPGTDPEPKVCQSIVDQHVQSPSMLTILPLQDWLACDGKLRRYSPGEEQINVPSNPRHYWRYRMHLTIEKLNQ